jgi:proline iminopeptidase
MRTTLHRALAITLALLVLPAAAADAPGRLIDGPAGKLFVDARGNATGRPLLIVNGGPGFDHGYLLSSPVWDELAKTRRVVMYDQRGTGRSTPVKPETSLTLADQLADIEAVRKSLGVEDIDLLGHSYGGALVMAYTARYPQRVKKLLIVDSAAPKWKDTIFLFSQVFPDVNERVDSFEFAAQFGDRASIEGGLREYLSMIFWDPDHRDAVLRQVSLKGFSRHVNEALDADMGRYDLNPEIAKFRMPVLVITGRYDMNVAPVIAWKIHKAIPGSRLVIFERSSHLPFLEEPERFKREVEDFLAAR